jgi:23S rRNA (adenine2503-C2)-methyltransferase
MRQEKKQEKRHLKGLDMPELLEFVESLGEKKYRAGQLFSWLYAKGAQSFEEMTDISKEFRAVLQQTASVDNLTLVTKRTSERDGTMKFLFRLHDGLQIETVLIPPEKNSPGAEKRLTLCVSTQVGCPLDCRFCATGTMGFLRNLTAGEIVDQVIQAQRHAGRRISNLVYMGMGEPMLNYENVMKSAAIITDDNSLNIGTGHITISTAGYADKIRRMADEGRKVKLALSLHSLDNVKRTELMPITKKFSVEELIESLEYYYQKTRIRPTLEYILFEGFNDTKGDVQKIVKLSHRVPCKVNIIPFHPIDFVHPSGFAKTLKPTPGPVMEAFVESLRKSDVTVMVRSSAGEDIEAACGQLAVQDKAATQRRTKNAHSSESSARLNPTPQVV